MKVVVNKRYGGFGLSNEAYEWLIENKGWTITEYNDDGFGYKNPEAKLVIPKGPSFGQKYYLTEREDECDFRSSPDVVDCVETLGEKADGTFARLEITEIPDDVEWEIGEYDGTEWIQELHRRWD